MFFAASIVLWVGLPAAAQTFLPKVIQFEGAPEYAAQELLNVAELKPGLALTQSEMQAHGQKLMDTGLFDNLTFRFNGGTLTYTLVPSVSLLPVRLQNFPPAIDKAAEKRLREQIPVYHGKVPAEGGLLNQVRGALEAMLAAQGITATVSAAPSTGVAPQKGAMGFSIMSPAVEVGEFKLDPAEAAPDAKAMEILAKLSGSAYDAAGSPDQIVTYVANYYHDRGYLEAAIHATAAEVATVTPEAVRIPFLVSIVPGQQYRLEGVRLAADCLVTQSEFDRQSRIHPGDVAEGQRLLDDWVLVSHQYHNRGYMAAAVHPVPAFDRARSTVSFSVSVEPGPVYTMGRLIIENGADDLRAAMQAAWKMAAGAVFNESAVDEYFQTQGNTPLGRTFASANCRYKITAHVDTRTVDVTLRLERKP